MRPVSDRLTEILTGSHRVQWRLRFVNDFPSGVNPSATNTGLLTLISGSMRFTADGAAFEGEFTSNAWGPLIPNGVEVFVELGVDLGGGQFEWVSQGYFRVKEVTQQNAPFGPVLITCDDRWGQLADTSSYNPYVAPATATLADYVSGILLGDQPWTVAAAAAFGPFANIISEWRTTKGTNTLQAELSLMEGSYGEQIDRIFSNRDLRAKFDYRGHFVVEDDVPTVWGYPVAEFVEGKNLQNLNVQVSREGVYNTWFATSSEPIPNFSPGWGRSTFIGPQAPRISLFTTGFGPVRRDVSSPFTKTADELIGLARSYLQKHPKGLPITAELDVVPHPGLEVGDVVRVTFSANNKAGLRRPGATSSSDSASVITRDPDRIHRVGNALYRGNQEWWFLGYNSFVWSANCGNPEEMMDEAEVEAWFDSMRHDGHGLVRLFFFRNWNIDRLDHAIAAAKERNIYILLCVDDAIAGCGEDFKDEDWFSNPVMRADYQAHFEFLLDRYKGEDTIAAFEYFNEPGAGHLGDPGASAATIRAFYDSMGLVRDSIDPNRLMSTGTIAPYVFGSGQTGRDGYRLIHESPGVDIASVHEYDQTEVISNHVAGSIANSDGKPLLIGEFGINSSETGTSCETDFTERATRFQAKTQAYVNLTGCCGALAWAWQPGSDFGECGFGTLDKDAASQAHLRNTNSTTKTGFLEEETVSLSTSDTISELHVVNSISYQLGSATCRLTTTVEGLR